MIDIKSETIAHYLRMRDWVLTQDLENSVEEVDMHYDIGENWYGRHCLYCIHVDCVISQCDDCGLSVYEKDEDFFSGSNYDCFNYWYDMNSSGTWAEWLKEWYNVVYYICVFG